MIWTCKVCGEHLAWSRHTQITPVRLNTSKEDVFPRLGGHKSGGNKKKETRTKMLKSLDRKDMNPDVERRYND